jgi:TonB family protein
MPIRCLFVAVLATSVIVGSARADTDPTLTDAPRDAKPITIIVPKVPTGPIPVGGVKVDIVGRVQLDGALKPESVVAPDGHERFAEAVSEVLNLWRFEPAADYDMCVPKEVPIQLSLWFEGTVEDPQIAVTLPKRPQTELVNTRILSQRSPPLQYPTNMLGIEGRVKVLIRIAPEGDVLSATVLSGTAGGGFDYVARRAAAAMVFKWKDAPDKPYCVVKTFQFCMGRADQVRFPFADCTSDRASRERAAQR